MTNWRNRIGKRQEQNELDWHFLLNKEFFEFMNEVRTLAEIYNWNLHGGKNGNYAVNLFQRKPRGVCCSIKMLPRDNYKYYFCLTKEINPKNVDNCEYTTLIGENMTEALKYLHLFLLDNDYECINKNDEYINMGGAYNHYNLDEKWENEKLFEEKLKELD